MMFEKKFVALSEAEVSNKTTRTFEGYGSVFGNTDSHGDTILHGAFADTLAAHADAGTLPRMFSNHAWSAASFSPQPFPAAVGKWQEMKEDDRGLYVRGRLFKEHPVAAAIHESMREGVMSGLSIGFYLDKEGYALRDEDDPFGGREISSVKNLVEVSIVDDPANAEAQVNLESVKSRLKGLTTLKDYEEILRSMGSISAELRQIGRAHV